MQKLLLPLDQYLWALVLFVITVLLKWQLKLDISIALYLVGAVIGIHLLNVLELVYGEGRGVFHSVIAQGLITIVALLFLTSSTNRLGQGVVLFLSLRYFFVQYQEFHKTKSLSSWGFPSTLSIKSNATNYLTILLTFIVIESVIFIFV